ncbi:DUF4494 family protein [uncultured Bacteroides sp.]|uniref:DUF4494 family protein n=1 Tax=uncultured Bacteroides sp. TaxID=162156 RepID=UPI002638F0D8|nr:DUF4494 family protein [uncultured Bacteroides sp.]
MNVNLFSVRISYLKEIDGKQKKVTENYLVNGWTFGEVEVRIQNLLKEECLEFLTIEDISRVKYEEYIPNDLLEEPKYYTIKNVYSYIDERGKVKKEKHYYVVASDSTENATNLFKAYMSGVNYDLDISGVIETNYLDIFMES